MDGFVSTPGAFAGGRGGGVPLGRRAIRGRRHGVLAGCFRHGREREPASGGRESVLFRAGLERLAVAERPLGSPHRGAGPLPVRANVPCAESNGAALRSLGRPCLHHGMRKKFLAS